MPQAKEDLQFWTKSGNKPALKKIALLIEAIIQNPFQGIGQPEPLKHQLSGKWSRRITGEHRLVYLIEDERLIIFQLRFHY